MDDNLRGSWRRIESRSGRYMSSQKVTVHLSRSTITFWNRRLSRGSEARNLYSCHSVSLRRSSNSRQVVPWHHTPQMLNSIPNCSDLWESCLHLPTWTSQTRKSRNDSFHPCQSNLDLMKAKSILDITTIIIACIVLSYESTYLAIDPIRLVSTWHHQMDLRKGTWGLCEKSNQGTIKTRRDSKNSHRYLITSEEPVTIKDGWWADILNRVAEPQWQTEPRHYT